MEKKKMKIKKNIFNKIKNFSNNKRFYFNNIDQDRLKYVSEHYLNDYKFSITNPEAFWKKQSKLVSWFRGYQDVVDQSNPPYNKWFKGGMINACFNAVDINVAEGRGDQTAIIFDSPVTKTKKQLTYNQLLEEVKNFSGVLHKMGLKKGDRAVIYMPNSPEAAIAMLSCARIGAIHSVVFGGFAPEQLAQRIQHSEAKFVISCSGSVEPKGEIHYKPLLDKAINLSSHKPEKCIILNREELNFRVEMGKRDYDWKLLLNEKNYPVIEGCVPVDSNHPLYILYTSGTTGDPKGVIRDTAGACVSLKWSVPAVFDCKPGDVFWASSDIGWVVGHSYMIYGPLLGGCTSVMYEGKPIGTPDAGAFWRVVEDYNVHTLVTSPTAMRAIRKEDPNGEFIKKHNLSGLDSLFLVGERADPSIIEWTGSHVKKRVLDQWWQTETGFPMGTFCLGYYENELKSKPGSCAFPVPGYNIQILNDENKVLPHGEVGEVCVKEPLPPGTFTTLWKNDKGFKTKYFDQHPGYYTTGDAGFIDEDGYLHIMTRVDDVINVSGHRLSTGAIEEVINANHNVAESAVFGINDELKGESPCAIVVLKNGVEKGDNISSELSQQVREKIGAISTVSKIVFVDHLPKTKSGKILRGVMRNIANKKEYKVPGTVEDISAVHHVEQRIKEVLKL
eukprot:TRINITY_DN3023_c0_g1_i2.p1 TRINITY_DN3023_c0_g1~~TRINITY_DN3023_c0_g1_i2.p1  ORF type:complete len:673 (-),score=179.43 TRINITY_DN3023_c0_g1_i2:60-2078(-)